MPKSPGPVPRWANRKRRVRLLISTRNTSAVEFARAVGSIVGIQKPMTDSRKGPALRRVRQQRLGERADGVNVSVRKEKLAEEQKAS